VANSSGGSEYWEAQLPHSRRYIIPNGLPVQEIDRIEAALPQGLERSETPIVLYVGRMVAHKRQIAFLEELAYVKQHQDVSGVLCGEGPQRSELEALSHKLGLDADIHFTGYLPAVSVWALMKKASVFVSLSAYEGHPNTVMESMRCGCPLVLSDIPAHREIIDESSTLFVDPTNRQQTANAIMQTLHDADASKRRALIAKQKTQKWTIEALAKDYESLYKEVI
jgi:glycosyltransferase involved in cell wall biosynthesis